MSGEAARARRGIAPGRRLRLVAALVCLVCAARAQDDLVRLRPPFAPNGGHAYTVALPADWASDGPGASSGSRVELLEDGVALGPAHALHADIRTLGAGRYSHWQGTLWFAASDGSDPNANGRRYEARRAHEPPGRARYPGVPPRDPFALMERDALAQAVAGGLPATAGGDDGVRPRLLWWYTIDALRAGTAHEVVDGRPLMPALAAFAREAVRFDLAYAPSSFTKTSTASMFTGLWPVRHRVMHGVQPVWPQGGELVFDLDPRFYTLAELLRDCGYTTLTHPYSVHVRPGDGMLQGFERTDLAAGTPVPVEALPERLFAYEHVLGVHGPYAPSDAARSALGLAPPRAVDPASTDWFARPLDERQLAELHDAYRAEAVDADRLLGERLAWIRAQGLWDDAVVIVTADHGEAFGEHGATQHASSLYEETVRVPLLVRFPASHRWAARHGERLPNRVGLVDLYATLVDLLGLPPDALPYALDGTSLGPILDGDERDPLAREQCLRTALTTRVPDVDGPVLLTCDAVLAGPLKGLLGFRMADSQRATRAYAAGDWYGELYDVVRDPQERDDLAAARGADVERLLDRLRARMAPLAARGAAPGKAPSAVDGSDPLLLERLRALGYLR